MESQQPDPCDLTGDDSSLGDVGPAEGESADEKREADGTVDTSGTDAGASFEQAVPAATGRPVGKDKRRRQAVPSPNPDTGAPAQPDEPEPPSGSEDGTVSGGEAGNRIGRWTGAAVAVGAALFVGSAAFAGATVQPYLVDRAMVATKIEIARTASAAITTLWTYTPETIDSLPDRAAVYLSGDLEAQYRKFTEAIVTPNKQAQVTNATDVVGVAVESLAGPVATVMVFTNTTSTSALSNNIPALKFVGYRLDMKRQGSRWLVTKMATVAFVDLTPNP